MKVLPLVLLSFLLTGCAVFSIPADHTGLPTFCNGFIAEISQEPGDSYLTNRNLWKTLNQRYNHAHPRKLVVFMDGTGNDKDDSSNIRKLYRLSLEQACNGVPLIPYYDKGVGAKWFEQIRGGVAGRGTELNIRQAYRFLVEAYQPGDEIYILGFSRGAFTARSLNGFIEFAGLLDARTVQSQWYDELPIPGLSNLHFTVKALYDVYETAHDGTPTFESKLRRILGDEKLARKLRDYKVAVTGIGVFDTVPALGILRNDEPDTHRLDLYAKRGYHALSLDEQRDDFRLLRFDPWRISNTQNLHEVWFAGVHSDVGGSYSQQFHCTGEDDYAGLATTPLNWMIRNFEGTEIFPRRPTPYAECPGGRLHDQYFADWNWIYQNIGMFPRRPKEGDYIHQSVVDRIRMSQVLRPHPHREPGGKYLFLNLPPDTDTERLIKQHFRVIPSSVIPENMTGH